MKLWIASAIGESAHRWAVAYLENLRSVAELGGGSRHSLAADPDDADAILFADFQFIYGDPGCQTLRRNELFRRFPGKSLVYEERDRTWLHWPGIYVSMPRRDFRPAYQESYAYLVNPFPRIVPTQDPDLLFSFVGSLTHPVRREVIELRHARGHVESVHGFVFFDPESVDFARRRDRFDALVARSKFVLCPRGHGTSSFRLYETMAAGRVPVILSDEWVAPAGPDWDAFSIRCAERDVARIPALLEEREAEFPGMSVAASGAYAQWFAPARVFEHAADACERLLTRDAPRRFPKHGIRGRAYVRAYTDEFRDVARRPLARALRRVRRMV